jgi:uncharacterized protein YegJ (DUF2314 family)
MRWIIAGLAIAVLVVAIVFFIRQRRRKKHRMLAIVGLRSERAMIDPAILATVAGKAWNADLGDGGSEGRDGFVAGAGITNMIVHDGRMFMVNSFDRPYVDNVEEVAESIVDLRLRGLFAQHAAWFSCDAMGVDGSTTDDEVRDWYRRLGRLFCELLDDECLAIYLPDNGRAYPINDDTIQALQADDVVTALQQALPAPMVGISDDDPAMVAAVQKARDEWPRFVAAFEATGGSDFAVKAPVTRGDATEYIWITVTALEGERIYGTLANEPAHLGSLKLGSKVMVPHSTLNDWCYVDPAGKAVGAFPVEVLQRAHKRGSK